MFLTQAWDGHCGSKIDGRILDSEGVVPVSLFDRTEQQQKDTSNTDKVFNHDRSF